MLMQLPDLHFVIHLAVHLLAPLPVALLFFRDRRVKAWIIMMATMVVDLDHLLADPIYDPDRCSIGFHPLHSYPAIAGYAVLAIPRLTRIPAVGLLVHMAVDGLDCLM